MSKRFWVSILAIVIIAIIVFALYTYLQIIYDAIMGLIEEILSFFTNLF